MNSEMKGGGKSVFLAKSHFITFHSGPMVCLYCTNKKVKHKGSSENTYFLEINSLLKGTYDEYCSRNVCLLLFVQQTTLSLLQNISSNTNPNTNTALLPLIKKKMKTKKQKKKKKKKMFMVLVWVTLLFLLPTKT